MHWKWIVHDEQLATLCGHLKQQTIISLDTEFVRETTFYAQPGLIQVASKAQVWLIDPLAIHHWQPFADLLTCAPVTKVMHACREDLEVLQQLTGVFPVGIFDTQLAAAYLNRGFSVGLKKLVETCLSIPLDKGATRSNWLKRPLSEQQCHYAATDAQLLLPLYQQLNQALQHRPLRIRQWFNDDCQHINQWVTQNMNKNQAWQSIGRTWQLNACQLNALRALCIWREDQARARDIPRHYVINNTALWNLAYALPTRVPKLQNIQELSPKLIRRYGTALLDCITQACHYVDHHLCAQVLDHPLPKKQHDTLKALQSRLHAFACAHNMATELLLSKKQLCRLIRHYTQPSHHETLPPPSIEGWRAHELVPLLMPSISTTTPSCDIPSSQ